MKYWCYQRSDSGIQERDFLGAGAKQYLDTCEKEIFDVWKERVSHSSDVSLANTLSRTIKRRFDDRVIRIDPEVSEQYGVCWLFQHRNDTSGKFLDIFREAHSRNITDFLMVTQCKEFKTKFNFDGSTMTFESVSEDFDDFVKILRPQQSVRLFYLVFADLAFDANIDREGGKGALTLHYSGN